VKRSAALVLTALLLTACTGSSEDSATSSGGAGSQAVDPMTTADEAVGDEDGGESAPVLGRADLVGSAVVRTAELAVRVDDVRAAADEAGRLAREGGGGVASERTDGVRDGGSATAELTLRAAPERFDELLGRLAALGEERRRSVSTEEVGDQLVDLESRLTTQRASVARVQALLAEAGSLGEVVQVEAELTRRTADLESLQARVAALRESVQLSTVVLRLDAGSDPGAAAAPGGFLDGLAGGWSALLASLTLLATVTGALLPFLPLLLVVWLVVRRRRPAREAAAT